ncbi:MAG: hypothetical protein P8X74_03810 [Reinekea sp.]
MFYRAPARRFKSCPLQPKKEKMKIIIISIILMSAPYIANAELYGAAADNMGEFYRTLSVIVPNTLHSRHSYQCKPRCLNQDNGGMGIQIGPVGHIDFTNSFNNRGYWDYIEFPAIGYQNRYIKFGICMMGGMMGGYSKKAAPVVWWKGEIGVNPFELIEDMDGSGFFKFNFFEFTSSPRNSVRLWWWTFSMKF